MRRCVKDCFKAQFPHGRICAVLITGSRWFGTANAQHSDWDFVVVAQDIIQLDDLASTLQYRNVNIFNRTHSTKAGYSGPIRTRLTHNSHSTEFTHTVTRTTTSLLDRMGQHAGIDISVYEVSQFRAAMRRHDMWAMPFLEYPTEGYWKTFRLHSPQSRRPEQLMHDDSAAIATASRPGIQNQSTEYDTALAGAGFKLYHLRLKKSIFDISNICLGQGVCYFKVGRVRQGKKRWAFAMRHIIFALQIVQRGYVYDHTAGNELATHIFRTKFPTCDAFREWSDPIFGSFGEELKALIVGSRPLESPADMQEYQTQGYLQTLRYIEAYGLECLEQSLSICVTPHLEHPELLWLKSINQESPSEVTVVHECCGLAVACTDKNPINWKVVCCSLRSCPTYDWGINPWPVI
eukprot:TRINITY_DN7176_c0_g1_i2.p1 TRINITY_DN7176_c0_g1~~TRINITY_DN7176_c0_g1_i2.p1  ORF type:complete len:406 (-),score=22.33 TRINITY_DN7176_c0_g1_i2:457-1674(-)